jgi:2-polyprenyl-3-methyl-5-hydroxy-6-metoxy-1,4-benzoquinol methylase
MDNDLDQTFFENIRQRIKITSIENLQIDELKPFDVITFWDCLEHLQSPFQILDKIKPSLTTNGTVFFKSK